MSDYTARLTTALAERYRIGRLLGQGGMAVVYLAHDLRHDRPVALKLLRPELMAVLGAERFLNEIKVTANLHHPHILPLHDSGEADGLVYYVMPFIQGESLRDKLTREKQLSIEETIEITKGVASALGHAHRHGVIHRDIKPENVLLVDGQPLVADFGIALAVSAAGGARITETGLSLGTPHYMSPEQAMGDRALDARSDIYSLAATVYEMLAGQPPYIGATAQAIVAKVITEKPTLVSVHRDTVPPHVAAAIHKALAKMPADRFHSAAEFVDALLRPGAVPISLASPAATPAAPVRFWRDRRALALAGLAAVAAGTALWGWLRQEPPRQVARFSMTFPMGQEVVTQLGVNVALSPDGSRLAYVSAGVSGQPQVWLRPLNQLTATALPGTERAVSPSFSPDGQSIVFSVGTTLKTVSVTGGPPVTLADTGGASAWGADGWVYYSRGSNLWRISPTGGPSERVARADSGVGLRHPQPLPGGRGVLVTLWRAVLSEANIGVVAVGSGEIRILARGVFARYAASGHLVYVRADGAVLAAPFDANRLALTGSATPLLDGVVVKAGGAAELALSASGTLLYLSGADPTKRLVWVNAQGKESPLDPGGARSYSTLALSPDDSRLAVSFPSEGSTMDLWVRDLRQGTMSRLTFDGQVNERPAWMPDGRRITFMSHRSGLRGLYTVPWDGSSAAESLLVLASRPIQEAVWTPDGRTLIYRVGPSPTVGRDLGYFRPGVDTAPRSFLASVFDESTPALSPDGRWLAYVSDESDRAEVYVRPFPGPGGRWQISTDGGIEPLWSRDGSAIYYRSLGAEMHRVEVQTVSGFAVGTRRRLFSTAAYTFSVAFRTYDVTADGRFVFMKPEGSQRQLIVVLNWFEELKRRAAGAQP